MHLQRIAGQQQTEFRPGLPTLAGPQRGHQYHLHPHPQQAANWPCIYGTPLVNPCSHCYTSRRHHSTAGRSPATEGASGRWSHLLPAADYLGAGAGCCTDLVHTCKEQSGQPGMRGLPHSSGDTLRRHQRQASTAHPSSSLLVSCTRHSQEHASGTQASHSTPRAAHPQYNNAHLKPGTQRAQQVSTISSGCHRAAVRAQGGRWHGNARVPLGCQPCMLRPAIVKHCPRPTQALIGPDGGMLCWQKRGAPALPARTQTQPFTFQPSQTRF